MMNGGMEKCANILQSQQACRKLIFKTCFAQFWLLCYFNVLLGIFLFQESVFNFFLTCNLLHKKSNQLFTWCHIYSRYQTRSAFLHFFKHFGPGLTVVSMHSKEVISLVSFNSRLHKGDNFYSGLLSLTL